MDDKSPFEIWQLVMTGRLKKFPNGYFKGSDAKEKAGFLLKSICSSRQWKKEEIPAKLTTTFFNQNKITSILCYVFHNDKFAFLDSAYPHIYKPWMLPKTPKNYWNLETAKEATIWLIEEKLKWSKKDVKEKLTKAIFDKNNVSCLYLDELNGSVYKALCNAYGDNYIQPWELKSTPMNFWTDENLAKPIYWLVNELGWSKEMLMELDEDKIKELGFFNAYDKCNQSLFQLLNIAYPGEYAKISNTLYYLPTMSRCSKKAINSSSAMSGIRYRKERKKWQSSIQIDKKTIYLGLFDSEEEAINARITYEKHLLQERHKI